ncbi:hypothetical protein Nepgr_031314 [Nepenthes gracilis]|uniref:Uncharacterized protein n=1 Tax=Nepenthes gracilis TaxID=150966 RepID=A0AAD3THV4_NEPGR|nr:hypothetical protein Nepgr_031314 [Nepenthes gracilis]
MLPASAECPQFWKDWGILLKLKHILLIVGGSGSLPSMEGLYATVNALIVGNLLGKWVLLLVSSSAYWWWSGSCCKLQEWLSSALFCLLEVLLLVMAEHLYRGTGCWRWLGFVGGAEMLLLAGTVALPFSKVLLVLPILVAVAVHLLLIPFRSLVVLGGADLAWLLISSCLEDCDDWHG